MLKKSAYAVIQQFSRGCVFKKLHVYRQYCGCFPKVNSTYISSFQVESNEAEKNPWMVKVTLREKSVFSPNTGKYGPEITPYLETLHAV